MDKKEKLKELESLKKEIRELKNKNIELEMIIFETKEKAKKYKNMLEFLGDQVSLIDREYNITWANRITRERYGEELIGKKCYNVYHGLDNPCEPRPCITKRALLDGKIHKHETVVEDMNGKKIYLNCSSSVAVWDDDGKPIEAIEISSDITGQKKTEHQRDELIKELKDAIKNIRDLSGLLPICSNCKNIRDDKGYWHKVEEYFHKDSITRFSHSICPECREKLYGDIENKTKD